MVNAEGQVTFLDRIGRFLADRLREETSGYEPFTPSDPEVLRRTLRHHPHRRQ